MNRGSIVFIVAAGMSSGWVSLPYTPLAPATVWAADDGEYPDAVNLGSMKIGNYDVEVFQEGAVEAGEEATFEIRIKGEPEPSAVRVWVGIESGRGSVKGKAHKHGDKMEVHCDVPDPMPADAKVWVELEVDGKKQAGGVSFK